MTHRSGSRRLGVKALTRVEGEGGLHVSVHDGQVTGVQLRIYEPPRFFEAFLRGRGHTEPPDITARICGICPVAYQMSACRAIEDACGVRVGGQLAELRRLLYCGEWIESHALHMYLLHAPDFLGLPDAIALARRDRATVERGLALKKAGNAVMDLVGGRSIHPVNVRLGGFYRLPTPRELATLTEPLRRALDDAVATARWATTFEFPDMTVDHEFLSLHDPGRYPIDTGTLVSSGGLAFSPAEYLAHVEEHQVPHSTALHATLDDRTFLVGPLARYTLNHRWLSPVAREVAGEIGLGPRCRNPFRGILVRAVETVHAIDEALRIIAAYDPPSAACVDVPPRAGVGHGVTEAPRGLLYHRYRLTEDGTIADATIVAPTAQNQPAIEEDLHHVVQAALNLDDHALAHLCERAIRNYDPCISCSAHFLDLTVSRT
ncbi:Ni/Fe hydrogenase subunit alpha [Actinophytocola oryzae]|uniref:Coenzyme F420-reducing hydrogenase alpha subunit n=1 Tax=Actinophytocola oryzae TaxID=502181 RepID=A0A4R7V5P2_9PSEU|nr:Ni/Fe hydrogenase subunit alpha [Actinophytocola oryzae]TDV44134.1 coenzyme F420-reducing hydrogenase alpha subunit [Actinophytocola oryzae]